MSEPPAPSFLPLVFERIPPDESRRRVAAFLAAMRRRRTVRDFSSEPVPAEVLDAAIEAAGTAPSGANRQPWTFVVVRDPEVKRRIREAAEQEEKEFYGGRAPSEWLAALARLGTDWRRPCLETAPCLVVVFRKDYEPGLDASGAEVKIKN